MSDSPTASDATRSHVSTFWCILMTVPGWAAESRECCAGWFHARRICGDDPSPRSRRVAHLGTTKPYKSDAMFCPAACGIGHAGLGNGGHGNGQSFASSVSRASVPFSAGNRPALLGPKQVGMAREMLPSSLVPPEEVGS
jgi:hypothetical protein